MSKFFVDWFSQQEEFNTDIEEMNKEELNKCLRKFYVCKKKGRRLLQQSNAYFDQSGH